MTKNKNQIVISGIAPSGTFHIGNYLGAIKQWVELQRSYYVFSMIADLHAITTPQDPKKLHGKILEAAKILVACGMDPKKSVIFIQSHVPAHVELGWIFNTLTPIGELQRMTQFKEKREKSGVLAGLLVYPTLMAADILIYNADAVPVGEDQLQHLELTRTLARKFNNCFGKTFKEPKALLQKNVARIMGLDDPTKKMSKSAASPNNYIALLDPPDEIRRKIKIAVTDSGKEIKYDPGSKPAVSNLMTIYVAFSEVNIASGSLSEQNSAWDTAYRDLEKRYAGRGYAEFKNDLAELLVEKLAPIRNKYRELSEDEGKIKKILAHGAQKASITANKMLAEVKGKVGLII